MCTFVLAKIYPHARTALQKINKYLVMIATICPMFSENEENLNLKLNVIEKPQSKMHFKPFTSTISNDEEVEVLEMSRVASFDTINTETTISTKIRDSISSESIEIDVPTWFKDNKISSLHEEVVPYSVSAVFKNCWLNANSYEDFLHGEGDVEIRREEWQQQSNITDSTIPDHHLFTHTRHFAFEHPRTTMLFLGPKNAPAKQVQYLYYNSDNLAGVDIHAEDFTPRQFIVVLATKFEGFPLCHTFRVMQYWTVSTSPLNDQHAVIRSGVYLDFFQHTMFQKYIISGTESELTQQIKRCLIFCNRVSCPTVNLHYKINFQKPFTGAFSFEDQNQEDISSSTKQEVKTQPLVAALSLTNAVKAVTASNIPLVSIFWH